MDPRLCLIPVRRKSFVRAAAACLSTALILEATLPAEVAAVVFGQSPRVGSAVALSPLQQLLRHCPPDAVHVGETRDVAGGGAPVVLIQDIHLHPEAQRQISRTLEALINGGTVNLVGVEGAFGPFDFAPFRAVPERDVVRRVAEALLKDGRLAAPSVAGMVSESSPPPFVGVDDVGHYVANVRAYRETTKVREGLARVIQDRRNRLLAHRDIECSPRAIRFDTIRRDFSRERLGMIAYAGELSSWGVGDRDLTDFVHASVLEKDIDMRRATAQLRKVFSLLQNRVSSDDLQALLMASRDPGRLAVAGSPLPILIADLAERHGHSMEAYPDLARFLFYSKTLNRIGVSGFHRALRAAENRFLQRCPPAERQILVESRHLDLSERLIHFSLSSADWETYLSSRKFSVDGLAAAEAFYEAADARSDAMVSRLLAASKGNRALVVGGFHTERIVSALRRLQIPYAVLSPRIGSVEAAGLPTYLSDFDPDGRPTDRFFEDAAHFLAPYRVNLPFPPAAEAALSRVAQEGGTTSRPESAVLAAHRLNRNAWGVTRAPYVEFFMPIDGKLTPGTQIVFGGMDEQLGAVMEVATGRLGVMHLEEIERAAWLSRRYYNCTSVNIRGLGGKAGAEFEVFATAHLVPGNGTFDDLERVLRFLASRYRDLEVVINDGPLARTPRAQLNRLIKNRLKDVAGNPVRLVSIKTRTRADANQGIDSLVTPEGVAFFTYRTVESAPRLLYFVPWPGRSQTGPRVPPILIRANRLKLDVLPSRKADRAQHFSTDEDYLLPGPDKINGAEDPVSGLVFEVDQGLMAMSHLHPGERASFLSKKFHGCTSVNFRADGESSRGPFTVLGTSHMFPGFGDNELVHVLGHLASKYSRIELIINESDWWPLDRARLDTLVNETLTDRRGGRIRIRDMQGRSPDLSKQGVDSLNTPEGVWFFTATPGSDDVNPLYFVPWKDPPVSRPDTDSTAPVGSSPNPEKPSVSARIGGAFTLLGALMAAALPVALVARSHPLMALGLVAILTLAAWPLSVVGGFGQGGMQPRAANPEDPDDDLSPLATAEGARLSDVLHRILVEVRFDTMNGGFRNRVTGGDYDVSPFPDEASFINPHRIRRMLADPGVRAQFNFTDRHSNALEFFMFGNPLTMEQLEEVFGESLRIHIPAFFAAGMFIPTDNGRVRMNGLSVISREISGGHVIYAVVDTPPYYATRLAPERVYIGPDSYMLMDRVARVQNVSGVVGEMGSGSGIQLISVLRRSDQVQLAVGIEKDRRARHVSVFNAHLNGVGHRLAIVPNAEGLAAVLNGRQISLAISNPPFMLVPDQIRVDPVETGAVSDRIQFLQGPDGPTLNLRELYPAAGWGGTDGLAVTRTMVADVLPHMAPQSRILIYSSFGGDDRGPTKIREFASTLPGWSLTFEHYSPPVRPNRADAMADQIMQVIVIQHPEFQIDPYKAFLMKNAREIEKTYRADGITSSYVGFAILGRNAPRVAAAPSPVVRARTPAKPAKRRKGRRGEANLELLGAIAGVGLLGLAMIHPALALGMAGSLTGALGILVAARHILASKKRGSLADARQIARLVLALSQDQVDDAEEILTSLSVRARWPKEVFLSPAFQRRVGREMRRVSEDGGVPFQWTSAMESACLQVLSAVFSESPDDEANLHVFVLNERPESDGQSPELLTARLLLARWRLGWKRPSILVVPKGREDAHRALAQRLKADLRTVDADLMGSNRDAAGRPSMTLDEFKRISRIDGDSMVLVYSGLTIRDERGRTVDLDALLPPLAALQVGSASLMAIVRTIQSAA